MHREFKIIKVLLLFIYLADCAVHYSDYQQIVRDTIISSTVDLSDDDKMLAIGTHTTFAYIYAYNGTKFVSNQTIYNKQHKDMLKVDISGDGNWLLIMSGIFKDTIAYVYKRQIGTFKIYQQFADEYTAGVLSNDHKYLILGTSLKIQVFLINEAQKKYILKQTIQMSSPLLSLQMSHDMFLIIVVQGRKMSIYNFNGQQFVPFQSIQTTLSTKLWSPTITKSHQYIGIVDFALSIAQIYKFDKDSGKFQQLNNNFTIDCNKSCPYPNKITFSQNLDIFSISSNYGIAVFSGLKDENIVLEQTLRGTKDCILTSDAEYLITAQTGSSIMSLVYQKAQKYQQG